MPNTIGYTVFSPPSAHATIVLNEGVGWPGSTIHSRSAQAGIAHVGWFWHSSTVTLHDRAFEGTPPASASRFSDRVEAYRNTRPGYPPSLVAWLDATFGLADGQAIADVGAGTGIFSLQLQARGAEVIAVEPNPQMRAALEVQVAAEQRVPTLHVRGGTAEATGMPDASADGVTAAQAFHWFDPEAFAGECRRVLRPRGWAATIWNNRRVSGSPFLEAYEAFVRQWGTDYARVGASYANVEHLAVLFGEVPTPALFENAQTLDRTGLLARLESSSYMPGADHLNYAPMREAAAQMFDAHAEGGLVELRYEAVAYASRL